MIVGGIAAVPLGTMGVASAGLPRFIGALATGFETLRKAILTIFGAFCLGVGLSAGMNYIFGSGNEEFDPCKCILSSH